MLQKMNQALEFLRGKYGIPAGTVSGNGKNWQLIRPGEEAVTLLWHRLERRFIELKKIIDSKTLEDISTYRFARFTPGGELDEIILRELDLVQYLADSKIVRIYAVKSGDCACNIIFRLQNGQSGCVECGTALPPGSEILDRHEIIARRGVASDRVVDTQIPQSSIYEWSSDGSRTFTDIDTELYGLPNDHIHVVRSAFQVLSQPETADTWSKQYQLLQQQLDAVNASAASGKTIQLNTCGGDK